MRKDETKRRIKAFILSKQFFIALMVLMCVLALISVVSVFLRFLGVSSFEIKGETSYKLSEIVSVSGIRSGDAMYSINESDAQERILKRCPFLKSVKVKKSFPNKVVFELEERLLGWYLQIGDDFYALDYDLCVLQETYDESALRERGLALLVLPELQSAICGSLPEFGRGDEHLIAETLKIIDLFRTHEMKSRITYLDLTNRFEIKLTLDETFTVNIGDTGDLETKLATVKSTVASAKESGFAGGELNMISPTAFSFKGYYAEQPQTQSTDGEETTEVE